MKQNKELIRFYIARFFNLLYFFIAVGVVYFEFRGFTLREAFMAMSFYSIMVVILEYPTGVIGDYFGHKASLLAATGVFVIVLFLLAFPWNMPVYYLLLGFLALGAALSSGSDVAMLHGLSKDFKRDYANYNIIIIVALFLASVIAGIVAKYSLPAVLLLSSLTGLIGGILLSTVKVKTIKSTEGNIFAVAKKGLSVVIKNSSLFLIVLFAGLVSEFQAGVKNVVVALATEPEYLIEIIGSIVGLNYLVRAIATQLSKKLPRISEWKLILAGVISLLFAVLTINYGYIPVVFYVLTGAFFTLLFINLTLDINELVTDDIRASVLSLRGLIMRLIGSGMLLVIGYILDVYSFKVLLIFNIGFFILAGIVYAILKKYFETTKGYRSFKLSS